MGTRVFLAGATSAIGKRPIRHDGSVLKVEMTTLDTQSKGISINE